MTEEIKSFVSQQNATFPFFIEMAGISYCDGSYRIHRNKSLIYCLEYVIEGIGTVQTRGQTFHPSAGDVYLLHQNDDHVYFSDDKNPWTKIWLNIRGSLPSALLTAYGLNNTCYFPQCNVFSYFNDILDMAYTSDISVSDFMHCAAIPFHKLVQDLSIHNRPENIDSHVSVAANTIKNYLETHIDEKITIEQLAKLNFLSHSQTIRIFKAAYGMSPYEYALQKKIETACMLLQNTNLLIKEIANKTGFTDEHYFSCFFKSKIGLSPKEYRKKIS